MRHSNALTAPGPVRARFFGLRSFVFLIIAGGIFVWAGVAFVQEAYVSHRLSQQVSDLRRANAEIASQTAGYKKDVQALASGTADEEVARLNGYARPNEKLYLVTTTTPSPSPPASPSNKASPSPKTH